MATQQATPTPIEPSVSVSSYRSVAIHGDLVALGDPWRETSFGVEAEPRPFGRAALPVLRFPAGAGRRIGVLRRFGGAMGGGR